MPIYSVGILRQFTAMHFLVGGDWGRENQWHSHHYRVEATFEGDSLDRHGYLIDIAAIVPQLDALVERYRDKTLNELPEMAGRNPGLETFATILADRLADSLADGLADNLTALTIKLWESEDAFATCRRSMLTPLER